MSDIKIRPFVMSAVHEAMQAHELDSVSYFDALHTAERMYSLNWKTFRQRKGTWTPADEARSRKYAVPNGTARNILDTDAEVQRILASRDIKLPLFRDKLAQILQSYTQSSQRTDEDLKYILADFIMFGKNAGEEAYPWTSTQYDEKWTFPARDVYAFWICLQHMCT